MSPSLIIGNVQPLQSQMEEICVDVKYADEFCSASPMWLSYEAWLSESATHSHQWLCHFCADRTNNSEKIKGGGLCVFVNEQ